MVLFVIYTKGYIFNTETQDKCFEVAAHNIYNYISAKVEIQPLAEENKTSPDVAITLCAGVEQKHPLRLVFGLSLMGYFSRSIGLGQQGTDKCINLIDHN